MLRSPSFHRTAPPATRFLALLAAGVASACAHRSQPLSAERAPVAPGAQVAAHAAGAAGPAVRVAMLDLAFYGKRANTLEPGDSLLAQLGTAVVRQHLGGAEGVLLLDSASVAAAREAAGPVEAAAGRPCNVVIACGRAVGRALGVPWVVMGKISKTSNLIWIFSGQLINVGTGELVMDDEYELKGDAHDMVTAGSRAFARRVARKIGGEPRT